MNRHRLRAAALLVGLCAAAGLSPGALGAPGLLVCHFDAADLNAAVNDFGGPWPEVVGFSYAPGEGCPAGDGGGSLDAGVSAPWGSYLMPIARSTSLSQGTLEFWVKLDWDFGDRAIRNLVMIPLAGGHWNTVAICHHGLMGPASEIYESNIMDGLDHPLGVEAGPDGLDWRRGEWHHVALCWTEHSQRFYGDGKLLAARNYAEPLQITPPVGKLYVGCSSTGMGETVRGYIDELRLCNLPLYAGMDSIPVPGERYPNALPPGLALAAEGVGASASSTAPEVTSETDVPELHDGVYGQEVRIGIFPDSGDATVTLGQEETVSGIVWSRDGRPFAGPEGQGWARADSLPRDFVVEVSRDGRRWTEVVKQERFKIDPRDLARMTAARLGVRFAPTLARQVRFRITGDTTARLGQWPLLDEVGVEDARGEPLPIAQVTTERTRFRRSYAAEKAIDGRVGEESCWKSATAGAGELTLTLPEPRRLSGVRWSRSREGLARDGTPAEVAVMTSPDGKVWETAAVRAGIAEPTACEVSFAPREAKAVRLVIQRTTDGEPPVIDEVSFAAGGEGQ